LNKRNLNNLKVYLAWHDSAQQLQQRLQQAQQQLNKPTKSNKTIANNKLFTAGRKRTIGA
jgi:exonuclease VII small subunit